MKTKEKTPKATRYIFVTGGVISGLGKGISSASLGYLLKQAGYNVIVQKFDPYLNLDPGTMSPTQHGEVYVTDDGAETDMDLGHYERFLDISMSRWNNTTAGQIYSTVLEAERRGKYQGKTVQVIPHITDEIIRRFTQIKKQGDFDIIISELGGTVGDIEILPFLEAIRQFENRLEPWEYMNIHVTLLPYVHSSEEIKTKPTQHSVQKLRELGLSPDMIICRSGSTGLDTAARNKISLFCNVRTEAVIDMPDAETIYEIPLFFKKQGVYLTVAKHLDLERPENPQLRELSSMVRRIKNPKYEIKVGIVSKHTEMKDSYKSITESFIHAGAINNTRVQLQWINTEDMENNSPKKSEKMLRSLDGILIPGGFAPQAIEGKIQAVGFAREKQIPFFGISLGMQIAVIEYARNVLGLQKANSKEFDPDTPHPLFDRMPHQKKAQQTDTPMRLGAYDCKLQPGTLIAKAYRQEIISERHRHYYEFNNAYREMLEEKGMHITGINQTLDLVEAIELQEHPWFVGVQFHPELKSRVAKAHPLFKNFVAAILKSKGL